MNRDKWLEDIDEGMVLPVMAREAIKEMLVDLFEVSSELYKANIEGIEKGLKESRTVDFPDFARHLKELKCNSTRGVYEQRQAVPRRIQERSS